METISKRIVYLMFGGESPEHEISIITAKQVFKNIDKEKYDVFPIYLDKENRLFYINNFQTFNLFPDFKKLHMSSVSLTLSNGKCTFSLNPIQKLPSPDVCFLSFHGGIGESGNIQGFIDMLGIPYTGPSQIGAVYGMDKIVMKMILGHEDVPILPWVYINKDKWETNQKDEIHKIKAFNPYPLIIKPSALGSSIGVEKVTSDEDLIDSIELNFLYGNQVVIEKFGINMRELNCSVRKNQGVIITSPIEEVFKTQDGIYSYDEKYVKGGKKSKTTNSEGMASSGSKNVPANIPKSVKEEILNISKKVYKLLHGESLMRIDFLYDDISGQVFVIEPNTIPGSFSFYLWQAVGTQYFELIDQLIEEAIRRFKEDKKFITTFDSPLLH